MQKMTSIKELNKVQKSWMNLNTEHGGTGWEKGNGILINLLDIGLSEIEIRSNLPVGESRINRLRGYNPKANMATHDSHRPVSQHALTCQDIAFLKSFIEVTDTKDGFSCAHRRRKKYVLEESAK